MIMYFRNPIFLVLPCVVGWLITRTQGWSSFDTSRNNKVSERSKSNFFFDPAQRTDQYGVDQRKYNLFQSNQDDSGFNSIVTREKIPLSTGVNAEVIYSIPDGTSAKPPLIFFHGSFHGAWCWEERFMPYFRNLGYPVVAYSWRGTNGTYAGDGVKKVLLQEHMDDLDSFFGWLPNIIDSDQKPILLAHSFGGLTLMKYMERLSRFYAPNDLFGGFVAMCSVPPSGNGDLTKRYLKRSLKLSLDIAAGLGMKQVLNNEGLCRSLFFDDTVAPIDIRRYQEYFRQDSTATIDLIDAVKQLPSKHRFENGEARFVKDLPPCLVIEASEDKIVDSEANVETATFLGLNPNDVMIVDSPHDVMLGGRWRNCADGILYWMQQEGL